MPLAVPLVAVAFVTALLGMAAVYEIWQRARAPRVCRTSVPAGCLPRPDLTAPFIMLIVIAFSGLAVSIAIVVWRLRDEGRWRELDAQESDGNTLSG